MHDVYSAEAQCQWKEKDIGAVDGEIDKDVGKSKHELT